MHAMEVALMQNYSTWQKLSYESIHQASDAFFLMLEAIKLLWSTPSTTFHPLHHMKNFNA